MLSKLSKNIKTISKLSKITKLSKNFNNFKYCQNVGQVMFPHHSDQMSQRSPHVSWVTLWMSISKVLSDWLSQWQGHLLSCCGQLKTCKCGSKKYHNLFYPILLLCISLFKADSGLEYFIDLVVLKLSKIGLVENAMQFERKLRCFWRMSRLQFCVDLMCFCVDFMSLL